MNIFFILFTIFLLSSQNQQVSRTKRTSFSLTTQKRKSFESTEHANIYQSFVLGNKRGLSQDVKGKFKDLGIYHLMTPSGLHYGIFIYFLHKILSLVRLNSRVTALFEMALGVITYSFLPSLFALKRVALLSSFRLFNRTYLNKYFDSIQTFSFVFIFDFFWGTRLFSSMSYLMSLMFIGIFALNHKKKTSLFYYLFIGQIIMAFIFNNQVSLINIILSPIYTYLFSVIYPLLCINLFFLDSLNFSSFLITALIKLLNFFHELSKITPYFEVTLLYLIIALVLNSKNLLLILAILFVTSIY